MRPTTPEGADLPHVAGREDVDADVLVLARSPRATPPAVDRSPVLPQEDGFSPLAAALVRHVQGLGADDAFSGVLSSGAAADAVAATVRAVVKTELQFFLDDDGPSAGDRVEDLGGSFDLTEPRLTTRGVAALAAPTSVEQERCRSS